MISYLVMNTERMYLEQNSKTLILTLCKKNLDIITEYKYTRLTFFINTLLLHVNIKEPPHL